MQTKRPNRKGRNAPPSAPAAVKAETPRATVAEPAPQVAAAPERDWSVWWTRASIAVLAVVAAVNVPQPWRLGFYLDDWATSAEPARIGRAFSAERLGFLFNVDRSRPGLAAIRWVFSSLLGESTFAWQFAMLAVNVAIAAALYRLIRVLDDRIPRLPAATIAALWLVQPWLGANRFWVVLLPVDVVVLLFCLMCIWVVRQWNAGQAPWAIPGLVYLACCLSYEAFYLQFVPVLMIGAALAWVGRAKWTQVAPTAAALAVGQAGGLLYRAFGPKTEGLVRTAASDVPGQIASFGRFFENFGQSFHELTIPVAVAAVAMLGLAGAIVWRTRREGDVSDARIASAVVAVWLAGAALGLAAYVFGGVAVAANGPNSRGTLFLSFWLPPAVAVAGMYLRRRSPRRLFTAIRLAAIALAVLLGAGYWMREQNWAHAWTKQQDILSHVPVALLQRTRPDGVILYVGTFSVEGAPVFSASWDIESAMRMKYPQVGNRAYRAYSPWLGDLKWDGAKLTSADGVVQIQAPVLYIWQGETGALFKCPRYTIIARDYSVNLPPFPAIQAQTQIP